MHQAEKREGEKLFGKNLARVMNSGNFIYAYFCEGLCIEVNICIRLFVAELYDNLGTMGASIKQHLVEGMRNMWQQLNEFARSHTSNTGFQSLEVEDNPGT